MSSFGVFLDETDLMPTEAVVTEEQVLEAARALAGRGKRVTGYTIRQVLGAGDPKRLAAIWAAHEAAHAAPSPVVLPAAFEDAATAEAERLTVGVHHLVLSLWQSAERLAEERVQAAVASLQERLEERSVDLEATGESLVKAEAERDTARAEASRRGDAILDLERRLAAADARSEHLHHEVRVEGQRAQEAMAAVERTRAEGRQDMERLQGLLSEAERRAASAEGQLEQTAGRAASAGERARAAEETARRAEQEARSALIAQAAAEGERNAALARAAAAEGQLERTGGRAASAGERARAAEETARRAGQEARSALIAQAAAEGERNAALARAAAAEARLEGREHPVTATPGKGSAQKPGTRA
jgi:colicin import membrane protein